MTDADVTTTCLQSLCSVGVARGGPRGPGPLTIKIPPMIKNYDNIALRCLIAVLFSVITHITVINNNIHDYEGAPGPLTNNQGAPGPLTDNQEALGPLNENQGAPNRQP